MNHVYRLVFNRALGIWQVASELARSSCGLDRAAKGVRTATLPRLRFAIWVAMGWAGLVIPAQAQSVPAGRIVADPNAPGSQRPTVLETSNGVPLVNITTPSAAGVSRNTYRQFDVGRQGAILNNARSSAQTQLGGWVQGNPWLATGSAKVILNEVNSVDPSRLHGYVEIAGQRADLIIANPAGIQIDGGGFLNASRVTLTTGRPAFSGGSLDGYRVEGGAIRVTGSGLDASRTDYTDLIARSLEVNAGIWAQRLQAITGAHTVSTDHGQINPESVATPAPAFALDVSTLGGMYAGKITLLGTEHGVGVRNAGAIGASAGELVVTIDGRLENSGSMQSQQTTRVAASDGLLNSGTLSAARELHIATAADIDNSGGTLNARRLELEAVSLRNRGGEIEQTGSQSLLLEANMLSNREHGRIGMAQSLSETRPDTGEPGSDPGSGSGGVGADRGHDDRGRHGTGDGAPPVSEPLAAGSLRIAGNLDNDGGRINAGRVDLALAHRLDNSGGFLGLHRLSLHAGDLGNVGGELKVTGDVQLDVGRIDNSDGRLEVAGALQLSAQQLSNRAGTLMHGGADAARVHVAGILDNHDGTLVSSASALTISSGILVNERGRVEHAGEDGLNIQVGTLAGRAGSILTRGEARIEASQADHRNATLSANQIFLDAQAFDNRGGTMLASGVGANRLNVDGVFDNGAGGILASPGDLQIQAGVFGNAGGKVQHSGSGALAIDASVLAGAGGTLVSSGALTLMGERTDLFGGTTVADRVAVDTGHLITAGGSLTAFGNQVLAVNARGTLDNSEGMITSNGTLDLAARSLINHDGELSAAGAGASRILAVETLSNSGGGIGIAGKFVVEAAHVINRSGTMRAGGDLHIATAGLLDNGANGAIASGGDLEIDAAVLDNARGAIEHAGEGMLSIAATALVGADGKIASNGTLTFTGESTDLRGAATTARRIAVDTGELTTADGTLVATSDESMTLNVRGVLDNTAGTIATNGALRIFASGLTNADGRVSSIGADLGLIAVRGALDNERGAIIANGALDIRGDDIRNTGGSFRSLDALHVTADGRLENNDGGGIASNGDLTVAARLLDNTAGRIEHAGGGTLAIQAASLDGAGGSLASNGTLRLTGEETNLRGGATSARTIVIGTGALITAGGTLDAIGTDALDVTVSGVHDNRDGTIATNGALRLNVSELDNVGGRITAAGTSTSALVVSDKLDNAGGTLAAAGSIFLDAGELRNVGGILSAVGDAALQLRVQNRLDNSGSGLLAADGDLELSAGVLDNSAGRIEHAGQGDLKVDVAALEGVGGRIASNGFLHLAADTADLRGGTTSARQIAIDTGALTTADGRLVATGGDPLQLRVRDLLNNDRGVVASNGVLDMSAGAIDNRGGTLQAAGDASSSLVAGGRIDNSDGIIATSGDTSIVAEEVRNARGKLQTAGDAALQVHAMGLLDNADGSVVTGGDLVVVADTLDNRDGSIAHAGQGISSVDARILQGAGGTLVSNGALRLTGDITNLQRGTTAAQRLEIDTGRLINTDGTLIAFGNDTLRLRMRDAFDNDRGTTASNGAIDMATASLHNRGGTIRAAGGAQTQVHVVDAFDNSGGQLASAGETTLRLGDFVNSGGVLRAASGSPLSITADRRVINDQGLIESNGAIMIGAQTLSNREGQVRTQRATDIVATGALDNTGGSLISGGDLTLTAAALVNRDTLDANASDSASSRGLFGMRVNVDAATLDNNRGRIHAGEALHLTNGILSNAAGRIDGGTTLTVSADTFDNTGGELVQRGADGELALTVAGNLDNVSGGLIGAEGHALVRSGSLDNSAGTVFARNGLQLASQRDLTNRGGVLRSGAALTLEASGAFDNGAGALDAAGAVALTATQFSNLGGQVLAGRTGDSTAGLDVVIAGVLDNRAGSLGSRGGDLTLRASAIDNREAGLLIAQRDLRLETAAVHNNGSTVYAGRHLNYENGDGTLDNAGGRFGAGDSARVTLARIGNTATGRIQAGTLWLATPALDNGGGEIGANVMEAQLAHWTGAGRLYGAQSLGAHFSGDFTYQAGQRLESDGALGLTVTGTFTNQGVLQSGSAVSVTAANVVNQGTINASNDRGTGVSRISASGSIDNHRGASIEGDTVILSARDVSNTGEIVGDAVAIEADTLTNGRDLGTGDAAHAYGEGFIGAADLLELRIARSLLNLDAELFSGGDLDVAGRTDGTRVGEIRNVSGRIQAEGDARIAADRLDNVRRVLEYAQGTLTPEQQAALRVETYGEQAETYGPAVSQLYDDYCSRDCMYFNVHQYVEMATPTDGIFVTRASREAVLSTGGDLTISAATVSNRHSAIAAGRDLIINGQAQSASSGESAAGVSNVGLSAQQTWQVTGDYLLDYQTCNTMHGVSCQFEPRSASGTLDFYTVTRTTYPEEGRATITAGRALGIVTGGDLTNTVVRAADGLVGIGPGALTGPGNTGLGAASAARAGSVDAISASAGWVAEGEGRVGSVAAGVVAAGAAIGTTSHGPVSRGNGTAAVSSERPVHDARFDRPVPQVVGTPERPLPGLVPPDNGMFDVVTDPGTPFLVTTAPRFVPDGTVGSEQLLSALGYAAAHKRLGDAYYEQRLVLEQILQLTGRRTLDGGDGLGQYRSLMHNAAAVASSLGLTLGMPLTSLQISALDQDIVWLVEQEIAGQSVLVPVVYLSQATAQRLRADGALIAADTVEAKAAATVRNDGTLHADKGMWLSADTLINDGALRSEGRLDLATRGDTFNRGMLAGGTVTIEAGRDFVQDAAGRLSSAGNAVVEAGRDLRLTATAASAGEHLVLGAGRDLSVAAQTATRHFVQDRQHGTRETLQASTLQAGGQVVLQAGQDLTLQAAQMQAGDGMAISAGRDLTLATVITTDTGINDVRGRRFRQRTETSSETVHGTQLQAGGDIAIVANRDALLTAATVRSDDGEIVLAAGRDVMLTAAEETHRIEQESVRKKKSLLSSKTTTTHAEATDTYAIGTTISGERVHVQAERDIGIVGSNVVSDAGTALVAGRDVTIEAAQDAHTESHSVAKRTSGVFGSGGLSFTIGSRRQSTQQASAETTAVASTVGATEGDVTIIAGNDYRQVGSHVLAPSGDVDIHARKVDIVEARETSQGSHTDKFRQSGLTVALSAPVIAALQTAQQMSSASGQTSDSRMQALAAGTTALAAYNAGTAVAADPQSGGGFNVSITIGGARSDSSTTWRGDAAAGSSVAAGGDVRITAAGAGQDSDITIRGSQVGAAGSARLEAEGDIALLAARNAYETERASSSASGGVGVAISYGQGGAAAGFTAYASGSKGQGEGSDVNWTNSRLSAGETLVLESGGETTLRGAVAEGRRIVANVGGDLTIESLQDTSRFRSRDQSASASVTVGYGFSASGSYGQQKIDSDYASVTEQSGLRAGDGGFQIDVKGRTELVGGVIGSSEEAIAQDRNLLTTGTLAYRDVANRAQFDASSLGVSGGYTSDNFSLVRSDGSRAGTAGGGVGTDQQGRAATGNQVPGTTLPNDNGWSATAPLAMSASDDASSTTRSGISAGRVIITDSEGQQALTGRTVDETVAGLNRDVSADTTNALKPIFDEQEIRAGFEIAGAFTRETATLIVNKAREADAKKARAEEAERQARDPGNGLSDAQRQALRDQAAVLYAEAGAIEAQWGAGGSHRQIATTLAAAAGGNVAAGGTQAVQALVVNYVQQQGAGYVGELVARGALREGSAAHAALHAIVACAGAAAGGQDCGSGAIGAAVSSLLTGLFDETRPDEPAAEREARRNLVTSLVAGLAAGGDVADLAAATQAATSAVDNNWLATQQVVQLNKELAAAGSAFEQAQVLAKWAYVSKQQDALTGLGMGKGLAEAGWNDVQGLVQFLSDPMAGVQGLKALITSPEARQQLGDAMFAELDAKLMRMETALQVGGTAHAEQLGRDLGELVWQVGGALTAVGGAAKAGVALARVGVNLTTQGLESLAGAAKFDRLLAQGGQFTINGKPMMDFSRLTSPQKSVVGELLGDEKIQQVLPGAQKIGRTPGIGETGIDDLYKIDKPGVDYVIVEYKFGASKLGKTLDGGQMSDGWLTGSSTGFNRIRDSVRDPELANGIEASLRSGRVERWIVHTDPYGKVSVGLLDKHGKFIPNPQQASKLLGGGP